VTAAKAAAARPALFFIIIFISSFTLKFCGPSAAVYDIFDRFGKIMRLAAQVLFVLASTAEICVNSNFFNNTP
jgi:hypothetical protein